MATATLPIGRLTESVDFLSSTPPAIAVTALTSIGSVASGVTGQPHNLTTGDYVAVRGAVPVGYNTTSRQVTVTGPNAFSYDVPPGLATPATGSITVTFDTDSQGGRPDKLYDAGHAFAYIEPLSAAERMAAGAVAPTVTYRAVVHYRAGLTPQMKFRWTRYQETLPRLLNIFGVYPHPEPAYAHRFLVLECGEVVAA
jgi:SPP1 family predicted phage head-tail adaptor